MHRYLPDLARRSVPRYTSYPTAAEFRDTVGAGEQGAVLDAIAPGAPVSLYLHIPYCQEICWYCGCTTGAVGRPERLGVYVEALERELDMVARRMRGHVVSVHFGGGSPNALEGAQFVALCDRIRARFDTAKPLEIAAELDPRTLDRAYADALARAGVTRVSLGAQTFAPHVQARINRVQPYAMVAQAVADLRAAGIAAVNLDLMYGLPEQSEEDLRATLEQALTLAPDRIALFGYAHMPRMIARQRMIDDASLPDARTRFEQSALAHDLLVDAGWRAIGFDHFARPEDSLSRAAEEGRLRRNFQGFTDEPGEAIIGIGASSISQYDGLLVQNEKHVGRYRETIAAGHLPGVRGVARTDEDRVRAAMIERLLCDERLDIAAVARAHGRTAESFADTLPALQALAARGLVRVDGWEVRILPAGRPYARLAAVVFDQYRNAAADRFSKAV